MEVGTKRRKISPEEHKKAAELEEFLFGTGADGLEGFGKEGEQAVEDSIANLVNEAGNEAEDDSFDPDDLGNLVFEDRTGLSSMAELDGRGDQAAEGATARQASAGQAGPSGRRKPVWDDPDDAQARINISGRNRLRKLRVHEAEAVLSGPDYEERLREQHAKLHPRTSWARKGRKQKKPIGDGIDADAAAEDLLQGAGPLLGKSAKLPMGRIELTRVKDANHEEPSRAVVQSVQFHPSGQLLLTAGFDKHLRFFQADGATNAKVQSVFLEDMPIHQAAFCRGGSQAVVAGRRKFFYIFDLGAAKVERISGIFGRDERSLESFVTCPTPAADPLIAFLGRDGCIPLVSLTSRQAVGSLKMSGTAKTAAFSADGQQLITSGGDGIIHTWDMRTRRCLGRAVDEGCLACSALALSPTGTLQASGSSSGVVNIYANQSSPLSQGTIDTGAAPTPAATASPIRSLLNLTTTIDSIAFGPDSQVLAMASRMKRNALRLVHLPSMTVFQNWPTAQTPLHYVHSLAFSPGGGMLAVGNARGKVLLYRLHHYPSI
ncbi:hypothetical protein WJX84_010773 [Apatococcus fuscideae]